MQYHPSPLKIKFLSRNVGTKSSQAGEKVIKTLFSVQLSGLDKADNLLKCENWPSVKFSNCFQTRRSVLGSDRMTQSDCSQIALWFFF